MSVIKRLKREAAKELSTILERMHPELFGTRIRPWKVGIHLDIMNRYRLVICELVQKRHPGMDDEDAQRIGARIVEAVLHRMAQHPRYSFAVLCHDYRYDLNGQKCGEVTEADKCFHRQKVKGRKKFPRMRRNRYARRNVA